MVFLIKLFCVALLLDIVNSESASLDKDCEKKFPRCEDDNGKWYTNTACVRPTCAPRKGCIEMPSDTEFRQAMLDIHNEMRNKVASGGDTTGGNTNAANMRALSYDLGLEYTSMCHVNNCRMGNDKCRGTELWPSAGQNRAASYYDLPRAVTQVDVDEYVTIAAFKDLVDGWYDEIKLADFSDLIENFSKSIEGTSEFTALVWATTTHMGCARAVDRSNETQFAMQLTCNYAPHGNLIGGQMYIKGPGCSKCPNGMKCNTKFKALCGEIDDKAVNAGANPYRSENSASKGYAIAPTATRKVLFITCLVLVMETLYRFVKYNLCGFDKISLIY